MAAISDFYKILGVPKDAAKDDIRKAYRKLSKKYHPDVNANDSEASNKFKDVQRAWDVLSDDEKRRNYDQYGSPDGPRFAEGRGGTAAGSGQSWGWSPRGDEEPPFDMEDLFSGFRRQPAGGHGTGQGAWPVRGQDVRANVEIPFMLAAEGGQYELMLQRDTSSAPESLTVTIPPGIDSGSVIRFVGQGSPGINHGQSGDLLISITIAPHPWFRREEANILLDLPISITECALGAKVDIPTLSDGIVSLTIPAGTSSGAKLRLKEKGIRDRRTGKRGDLFAIVKIVAPRQPDERSKQLLNELNGSLQQTPRAGLWGMS